MTQPLLCHVRVHGAAPPFKRCSHETNLLYSEVVCLLSTEKHSENDIDFIASFY